MLSDTLFHSPLYDPNSKVKRFRFDEDYNQITLKLLGVGALYNDQRFPKPNKIRIDNTNIPISWKRPREITGRPFFIDGQPSRFDAIQGGYSADCWVVCAMHTLVRSNEQLFNHVVPPDQGFGDNYTGAFHFRFWRLGTWYDVVVDDSLPVYQDRLFNVVSRWGRPVFWASLMEKAYAKFCGTGPDYYDSLSNGHPMTALQSFSGGIVESVVVGENVERRKGRRKLKDFLSEVYWKRAMIHCVPHDAIDQEATGIWIKHVYSVTKVLKFIDADPDYHGLCLVRLLNPTADAEWKGSWSDDDFHLWKQIDREIKERINLEDRFDGEFWIEDTDFAKFFEKVFVCHLGPGLYLDAHSVYHHYTWRTTSFFGEWVNGISAVGFEKVHRHKNPQYKIRLERLDDRHDEVNVVIELTHWAKVGRLRTQYIAFYVYFLEDKYIHDPLDQDFINNHNSENEPDFRLSEGRVYSDCMWLKPGVYCIIPCGLYSNFESQFLLRVFSEDRVDRWEYDTKIGRSLPAEERGPRERDEELRSLFNKVAQGREEIDWVALKEILETAINPKKSFFGMISNFFKFVRGVFGTPDDCETGDVVFTKDECRSMVAMLDHDHSGKLSFSELSGLWSKICFWSEVYEQHREEAEGSLTVAQLRDALSAVGYNINARSVHSLSYVYADELGHVVLTDFILCGVSLETVLALCEKAHRGNEITFTLDEWVKNTLNV